VRVGQHVRNLLVGGGVAPVMRGEMMLLGNVVSWRGEGDLVAGHGVVHGGVGDGHVCDVYVRAQEVDLCVQILLYRR